MNIIKNKIRICENSGLDRNSLKWVKLNISLHYMNYMLGDESSLERAYEAAVSAFEECQSSVELLFYNIFFHFELARFDEGDKLLEGFKHYVGHYKSKYPKLYAGYLFLLGMQNLDEKNVKKHAEIIEEIAQEHEEPIFNELLCFMYMKCNNLDKSYGFLELAQMQGSRSPFIYMCFHKIFMSGGRFYKTNVLVDYLKWANSKNIITSEDLGKNAGMIKGHVETNMSLIKDIYNKLDEKPEWLLIEICNELAKSSDTSIEAYRFYKEVEQRQINTNDYNRVLIHSAYRNNIEDISRYSMEVYIEEGIKDLEITPFIYHTLLTSDKFSGLIEKFNLTTEILYVANLGAGNGQSGRYYNSIYRFALENSEELEEDAKAVMEHCLNKDMFVYELEATSEEAKFVWVNERERKYAAIYELENGKCSINIFSKYFRVICLDKDKKDIVEESPPMVRQLVNADMWLYKYFYKKEQIDASLVLALAAHYISESEDSDEAIEILNRALLNRNISNAFRIDISLTLGKILFALSRYDKALEYYKEVDERFLNERYIETMFTCFMNTGEYDKAVSLILQKSELLTERVLFGALHTIIGIKKYRHQVVYALYELILKGYYDKNFLDVVIEHYKGSQKEWHVLEQALRNMNITEPALDERILENAIFVRDISEESQDIFLRMHKLRRATPIVDKFILYICFEVIKNNKNISPNVLIVLEKLCELNQSNMLLMALATVYIQKKVSTHSSERIIKKALTIIEETGIMLPVFMDLDEKYLTETIERNVCISYHGTEGKRIYLHYKSQGDEEFITEQMFYFKFGIYVFNLCVFHNEIISYFFSEEEDGVPPENYELLTARNNRITLKQGAEDNFSLINNAAIYYEMYKYDDLESILPVLFKKPEKPRFTVL